MKDALYFLNRHNLLEKTNGDLVEETSCIKHHLVFEFGDYITATMIYA